MDDRFTDVNNYILIKGLYKNIDTWLIRKPIRTFVLNAKKEFIQETQKTHRHEQTIIKEIWEYRTGTVSDN